jgi:hypothetical protein
MNSRTLYDCSSTVNAYLAANVYRPYLRFSIPICVIILLVFLLSFLFPGAWVDSFVDCVYDFHYCIALVTTIHIVLYELILFRFVKLGGMEAISKGNLDDLMYAKTCGCICTDAKSMALAAKLGHFAIVNYLCEELRGDWNEIACEYAAANGHSEVLRYLLDKGCPVNERTCEAAARNGHLQCLISAHESGCRWNARTTSTAFQRGHYDCYQYAVENGCPFPRGHETAAKVIQAWWRDRMYRYGSSFVTRVVKTRFESTQSTILS